VFRALEGATQRWQHQRQPDTRTAKPHPTQQLGWAKLQELRRYIELFKASGKFTVCWMKIATEKEFYLASAFQEVYIPPSASIRLTGFAVAGVWLVGLAGW